MKICSKICNECPFKKDSAKGWLGGETVESTLAFIEKEVDFSCHLTREDGVEQRYCRGYLIFYKKMCKLPKYNPELKEVLKEISFDEMVGSDIFNTTVEFKEHHGL